jgi:rhamnogalacturonyl hydrolase YesR
MMMHSSLACIFLTLAAAQLSPRDLAERSIAALLQQPLTSPLHHLPDYGVAIAYSAAYESMRVFPGLDWGAFLSSRLDAFAAKAGTPAYQFLHNESIPWGYSIGDTTGLFPIAYLSRALHANNSDPTSVDWRLALGIVERYVMGWPLRLPDGTISRHAGWWGQPDANASFLWQDDQFMGLALAARLVRYAPLAPPTRQRYQDFLASQHALFASHCQDAALGLYRHGYNGATGEHSCCFWGRANGWVMMAHAEVALALAATSPPHPALPAVQQVWTRHASALAALLPPPPAAASADQRLHQVLDDASTFQETSVTAMACYSIAVGLARGWLPPARFHDPLTALYSGVAGALSQDGTVQGICEGTGIGNTTAFYEARKTLYSLSAPGLGAVFRCAIAYEEYVGGGGA